MFGSEKGLGQGSTCLSSDGTPFLPKVGARRNGRRTAGGRLGSRGRRNITHLVRGEWGLLGAIFGRARGLSPRQHIDNSERREGRRQAEIFSVNAAGFHWAAKTCPRVRDHQAGGRSSRAQAGPGSGRDPRLDGRKGNAHEARGHRGRQPGEQQLVARCRCRAKGRVRAAARVEGTTSSHAGRQETAIKGTTETEPSQFSRLAYRGQTT